MNFKAKRIIVRTHGGLGNQLFQIFFARLYASQHNLVMHEIHDDNYPHAFARCQDISRANEPTNWHKIISSTRIPKVLERLFGRTEKPIRLFSSIYLDSYFQSPDIYEQFHQNSIRDELNNIANELQVTLASETVNLVHLRVGDFFSNKEDAISHVIKRLKTIQDGSHLMTNDESLLQESEVATIIKEKNAKIITTEGLDAGDVLRMMARYKFIDANDSTLLFWAVVLSGGSVEFKDTRLRKCYTLFIKCRQN